MENVQDYYATPEAELGQDESESPGPERVPTTFGDTLSAIVKLLPKVWLALFGYALLWSVLYFGVLVVMMVVIGASAAMGAPLAAVLSVLGGLLIATMGSYFWTLAFKRIDNIYGHQTKGGEWSFAAGRFLRVIGAFILKGLVVVPFIGVAGMMMWTMLETTDDSLAMFFGLMAVVFMIQVAGFVVYSLVHFADLAVIVEDTGVIEGMRRSFALLRRFRDWIYAIGLFMVTVILVWVVTMLLYCVIAIPLGLIAAMVMEVVGPEAGVVIYGLSNLFSGLVSLATMPVFAVTNYMIFQSLRARWELGREPTW